MAEDYRNTRYCPILQDLDQKKKNIVELIIKDHPRAIDMHSYISNNDSEYKAEFIKAYNGKCAYCGTSLELIPKTAFEIDHFIYQKSPEFKDENGRFSKAAAGYIENLVLSCAYCNRNKRSFLIPKEERERLNPDTDTICNLLIRDDMYYIRISNVEQNNSIVQDFYKQLKLESDIHRLDYLLMSMIGLQDKMISKNNRIALLDHAIELLKKKRNIMA